MKNQIGTEICKYSEFLKYPHNFKHLQPSNGIGLQKKINIFFLFIALKLIEILEKILTSRFSKDCKTDNLLISVTAISNYLIIHHLFYKVSFLVLFTTAYFTKCRS